MLRAPVKSSVFIQKPWIRNSSSNFIRQSFIDYFVDTHSHKLVRSSSVVPLYDSTVPFVNAGMNQFKGIFLGKVAAPYLRVVNSQKCVRVGGKHNDLDLVGLDGHHHTFFEMLGNWSFGDYYKKDACKMAWDLLLGPYRLKPENLVVTYFDGDVSIGLTADTECRDIWKAIGVPKERLKGMGRRDNFWEMGETGPCGPCTEIHYVNPDGSLTEIWNIVFIQCNRDADGKVSALHQNHVDTGMGLERITTVLQRVPSNYDTDLFEPLIKAIEKNSKGVPKYGGKYTDDAVLDCAYRRLADHARMISICLSDSVYPSYSLNLKQIMRKSFKLSTDVFKNPQLVSILYDEVTKSLGVTYPELFEKELDAKLVIDHEEQAYQRLRISLAERQKELVDKYPEVQSMADLELAGFAMGYREFKETMEKKKTKEIPGDLVFKLYDTHGLQEDVIKRIADVNKCSIDKQGFWKLLSKHKTRHKTAFKEQGRNRAQLFNTAIKTLEKNGHKYTDDAFKYEFSVHDKKIEFQPLTTKVVAILNEELEWIDCLEACQTRPYYIVTKESNFYCEEGGQIADDGIIYVSNNVAFQVDSVFKIKGFVFHKGFFTVGGNYNKWVSVDGEVEIEIDAEKRLRLMQNHTAAHLLNAAVRRVLPKSVICQTGSKVTDRGLQLNFSVYGETLSQNVILEMQELIRASISSDAAVETCISNSVDIWREASVITIPGETYPDVGLRLISIKPPLISRELCCGTHVPSTGFIEEFCVTLVKGANGHSPVIHAITGETAKEARELFCQAEKLDEVIDLVNPERKKEEISRIKKQLLDIIGKGGAPYGEYANCLALLDSFSKREISKNDFALHQVAEAEVAEVVQQAADQGRSFVVHFLRCSYLMQTDGVRRVLAQQAGSAAAAAQQPGDSTALVHPASTVATLLMGCAGGIIIAACTVPRQLVSETFTARSWLNCIVPVFKAGVVVPPPSQSLETYAEMTATKVSLINCEQLVQDAMRVAIQFAKNNTKDKDIDNTKTNKTLTRQKN